MKKMKKVMAAAIAMMTFSTAATVTGTVAWFTASNVVTANGMYVMADKEEGIVIANEGFDSWATSVTASHDGKVDSQQAKFIPTSTVDASTWAHASASIQNDKTAVESSYAMISPTLIGSTGVYQASINGNNKNIYLLNTFYIKSASTEIVNSDLYAKVTAEVTHEDNLNKTLRVLVKHSDDEQIFAPIQGATLSYDVCTAVSGETVTKTAATAKYNEVVKLSESVTIPANNPSAPDITTFPVNIYAYFEGEDAACYSDNITTTLADLQITVKLGTTATL